MAAQLPTADEVRTIIREELRAAIAQLKASNESPDDELDTTSAAELARVSPETVRDWIKRRGLPARRPAGAREHRIRRADLQEFLATPSRRRPPPPGSPVDVAAAARKMMERSRRG